MKQLTKVRFTKHYKGIGLCWYIMFAWYDIWIGFYWKNKTKTLYICLLPCCVIQVSFRKKEE